MIQVDLDTANSTNELYQTYYPPPLQTTVHYGWVCPRCHIVHAPSVLTCYCAGGGYTISYTTNTPIMGGGSK